MTTAFKRGPYRIGIDARFYRRSTSGIGRYTRELLHGLGHLDQHNRYVIFLTPEDFNEWEHDYPNFEPVVVPISHYTPAEQTSFLKVLLAAKLDLMHFLNFNHPVLYRRPFVTTLHDLTLFHMPESAGKSATSAARRKAFLAVFKHSLTAAKKVIAISEHSAADAAKTFGISHAKMEVIYEGAPVAQQLPFGSKKRVQDYLHVKEPYFLFVSQWRGHKGILTLVEAFERFKSETGLPHKLVLVGNQEAATPEVRERLVASSAASDIVAPGFVPDEILPALYTYAAAFVMPSEYEGFGLPVLEALVYGAPTIVADNSSLPEVGGKAARFFKTGDATQLAQALAEVATDEKLVEKMRKAGFIHVRNFDWSRMAARTLEVYRGLLERTR